MSGIRAQVVFRTATDLPKDRVTNTFYFWNASEGEFPVAAEVIALLLQEFYETLWESPYAYGNWVRLSGGFWINFYDMSQPEPRVPYRVDISGSGFAGGASLTPAEVSTVMSFHGAPINGQSQARRRGRIYIPGINDSMIEQATSGAYPTFKAAWLARVNTCAAALQAASGSALVGWNVYSQVAGTYAPVVGGWVDEAPDTQRRRGQSATSRVTWTT
uniref:Uncharacterized protein n=1 Tax=uncultured prokaryote TaxID=198431 RepID=A0A0H5Q155_9ZZZZ|nr:hypothetical protein [uncultured prokaryote]